MDDFLINRLWPSNDFGYCYSPFIGASGGLCCIWNLSVLSPTRIVTYSRWISLEFELSSIQYKFILVYGWSAAADRVSLWAELSTELQTDRTCFLMGDFNEILHPEERFNFTGYTPWMRDFMQFVQTYNLTEAQLSGRYFTWQNSNSRSKIDRCFLSPTIFSIWPHFELKALPRSFSDHVPLLFSSVSSIDWGPKPFKSINAWWNDASFYNLILESWKAISINKPGADLVVKLRELRIIIKDWNKNVFGNLNTKFDKVQQDIHALEANMDEGPISELDSARWADLHSEFYDVSKNLESLWHQKSRLNWNLHGDKNTKFFHTIAAIHSRSNLITEIVVDNKTFSFPEDIRFNIQTYYKHLFRQHLLINFSMVEQPIKALSHIQAAELVKDFSESEIFAALSDCDDNKAPGPDGFNFFFYKRAWPILKQDFLDLFDKFYKTGFFPHGLNTAFLVLIPKMKGASDIKDFRPISLINGVFKLLSKVLANRLSPILPSLISENQFGFIKGRNIHDCHMIASELIHLVNKRKDQVFLIKLDFKKAFDSISWNFILQMLSTMNFDPIWIKWITSFFGSAQLSVLINGSPSKNFNMGRGVRQGDPISPMLFVLAVEGLKAIFSNANHLGLIDGIHVGNYAEPISILQFADDTLLFIPNNLEMVRNLLRILRCFELISGLQINFQKSAIVGLNVDDASLNAAAEILQCKIDFLPFTYLGLPLGSKSVKAGLWEPIVNNFTSQLATWKGKLLSPAGRLVLIKSVLSSLPVYYLCSFSIPQSVINTLERYMRRFLWSGSGDNMGFSKVSWNDVCLPIDRGGLNITPMRLKNQSLLLKWIWKLRTSSKLTLWFEVISCSSDITDWRDLETINIGKLSHLWRGIYNACVKNSHIWNSFKGELTAILGNGANIDFWQDKWAGNLTLSCTFPRLFSLAMDKQVSVLETFNVDHNSFGIRWKRRLRVGDQQLLQQLQDQIVTFVPDVESRDHFCWNKKENYTPAAFRQLLQHSSSSVQFNISLSSAANRRVTHQLPRHLNCSYFWDFRIPPKINFFLWLLMRDRISSKAALAHRGILHTENINCSYCSLDETSLHIVMHCRYAWLTWNKLLHMCDVHTALPFNLLEFFSFWTSLSVKRYRVLWQTIWFFCIWELWKARNKRVFQNLFVEVDQVIFMAVCKAVEFYKDNNRNFPYSGNDVLRNLIFFCNCY
ncbi:uncharacterized protein LOC126664492 [Mercurialis annua]|uniref:uncharacterized protein LOC126664492 n=1 Tax=Mercurialis annua TaxID=3986 RepID=UPI00215E01F6|nr:uncharacterized protein LOC126664492 [Mercurialis annua]